MNKEVNNIQIFTNEEKNIIRNFPNMLLGKKSEEIKKIFENPKITRYIVNKDLFWPNLDTILKYVGKDILIILENLNMINREYAFRNIEKIITFSIEECDDYQILFFCKHNNISVDRIIKTIIKKDYAFEDNHIIKYLCNIDIMPIIDNMDYFFKNCFNLLELKQIINEKGFTINENSNKIMDDNIDKIINEMVKDASINVNDLKKEKLYNTLKIIIDELLENEHLQYHDIVKLGRGSSSTVFQIGSKVLKLGIERETFYMDNNKYFLKPLYRANWYSCDNKKFLLCIEITEKVDTKSVNSNDLYDIYYYLRENGLIWLDANVGNIGRLIKDNKTYFNNLTPALAATSYTTENTETLKAGNIVILDNDYIYTKNEFKRKYKLRFYNGIKTMLLNNLVVSDLEQDYQEKRRLLRKG